MSMSIWRKCITASRTGRITIIIGSKNLPYLLDVIDVMCRHMAA
jgi:hypothetical protein